MPLLDTKFYLREKIEPSLTLWAKPVCIYTIAKKTR